MRFCHSTISSEGTARSRNKLYEINHCYGNSLFLFAIGWNKTSRAINSQLARGRAVTWLHALSPKERADLYIFIEVFFVNWVASSYDNYLEWFTSNLSKTFLWKKGKGIMNLQGRSQDFSKGGSQRLLTGLSCRIIAAWRSILTKDKSPWRKYFTKNKF